MPTPLTNHQQYFTIIIINYMKAHRIREYREKAGLSQVELARRVEVASTNLSAIECGRLAPWPKVKKALARELKVSEAELFPA